MTNQPRKSAGSMPAALSAMIIWLSVAVVSMPFSSGCGDDDDGPPSCDLADPVCPGDQVCVPSQSDPERGVCQEPEMCDPDGEPCPGDLVCRPAADESEQSWCVNQCDWTDANECGDGTVCDPIRVPCDPEDAACNALPEDRRYELRYTCLAPVIFEGLVAETTTGDAIEGALVAARDATGAVVTDLSESDEVGRYSLIVPVARDSWGDPVEGGFTLRADAADYLPFPHGIRPALPIDASTAVESEDHWLLDDPTTQVSLIPLPEEQRGLARIEGHVLEDVLVASVGVGGVLVVAEGDETPSPFGYSDRSGAFVIFNVAPGDYTLRGYRQGLQLDPLALGISEGEVVTDADLETIDVPLGELSGPINLVNAPGDSSTSVVLVPDSVFDADLARGEVPFGLRDPEPGIPPSIRNSYTIDGVPDGRYAILAAFENDDLVRDPDPGISGTQIVFIDIPDAEDSRDIIVPSTFKITEALAVISPGSEGPEGVATTQPDLIWADDSGEQFFYLVVYDALGNLVWEVPSVDRVTGDHTVAVTYDGPALEVGMYYQFRATSNDDDGAMSSTEDLKGVFFLEE